MTQKSFSDVEYAGKRKQTRRERFLAEMEQVMPRAKVEHPFRVINRQFGYTKMRFRGPTKNTAQLITLFAL